MATIDRDLHEPRAAIPPFEPPPLPASITESARRILWIVGIYRAVCGAVLLGIALLLDLKDLNVATPHAFVIAAGLYFLYALGAFWWVQQARLPMPLPQTLLALLGGDVFFLSWVMTAGGPNHASEVLGTHMYRSAFRDDVAGYASAVATVIFLITLAIGAMQIKLQRDH